MVVQIRWGNATRPGRRTLAVEGASLDEVFKRIASTFRRVPDETGTGPPSPSGTASTETAAGEVVGQADLQSPSTATMGTVSWVEDLREGRFGPPATLVQIQLADRTVLLRLPGIHIFSAGTPVEVDGISGHGSFFLAKVLSGGSRGRAVYLTERIL